MTAHSLKIALLLFGSGLCALVYQTAWLREFRLIFGASTAATAAVLGIFMGGLGLGGVYFGARADRRERPLLFYARLEMAIAGSAAVTPGLVWLARWLYVAAGGTVTLGATVGTVLRLVLASLVLAVPTFLMGGTLPAAARAAESADDAGRRGLAALYGLNTLGAVMGVLLATFFLLETFGTRQTLWLACLVNLMVAIVAQALSRTLEREPRPVTEPVGTGGRPAPMFVLAAAAVVGFAFLLMEIVWYRMLSPLLGGTTFTFGLILAVALLGIGLGGAAYAILRGNRPATVAGFALVCLLEAVFIAVPYALGDRIAFLALLLRPLGTIGFIGHVLGWSLVAAIVVFPAAFVSGVQFPWLIALLGEGEEDVGRHVGLAYAWNTAGAIVGSLAGGFGLLPWLTAPGTWKLVVVSLVVLGIAALAVDPRRRRLGRFVAPVTAGALALLMLFAVGPTAAWRHSPIGAGRATQPSDATRNQLLDWANQSRRSISWQAEGIESSVALSSEAGLSFIVNGKNDGHAVLDAGTSVMGGLIGALTHPAPKSAMVIGLGTGSTAGWLGAIPAMERVDAVEFEPAIVEVAKFCSEVNAGAITNPKVHTILGDAREVLITTPRRYDLIFSEPSNPYRAGIANLFTRDFYRLTLPRLNDDGLFLQWVQAYEVDSATIETAYATLSAVFPSVETWQMRSNDLLFVCSRKPIVHDVSTLRARILEHPYRPALNQVWRVDSAEGFLSHFIARSSFARAVSENPAISVNTDDHPVLEFAFAKSVGKRTGFDVAELLELARKRNEDRPEITGGTVDWEAVDDARESFKVMSRAVPTPRAGASPDQRARMAALASYANQQFDAVTRYWKTQAGPPRDFTQLVMLAEALAYEGGDDALPAIAEVRRFHPVEADAVLARWHWTRKRPIDALAALEAAFTGYRGTPWPNPMLMERTVALAVEIARADPTKQVAARLFTALEKPFGAFQLDGQRKAARVEIARAIDGDGFGPATVQAVEAFEPYIPWTEGFLSLRLNCYRSVNNPRAFQAQSDLDEFLRYEPVPFGSGRWSVAGGQ